jgi:hypothetical protein
VKALAFNDLFRVSLTLPAPFSSVWRAGKQAIPGVCGKILRPPAVGGI